MAQTRKPKFFYGYIVVLAAFSIWMTAWGTSTTYGVFFKPLLTEFGWTRAMTAGARSVTAGIIGLLGMVTGGLTDRFGPRGVLLIFGSFLGIGYLLMSQVSNLWQYYTVYGVVVGVGLSVAAIPTLTTIARWFVKRRGFMTGIVQAGSGIGGMVLSPLAAWLILTYGWRSAFSVLGIIALVFIISSGLLLKRDPGQTGQLPYGTDETTALPVSNPGTRPQIAGFSLREAIRTKQFWTLCVMLFGFGFCRATTLTHIAAHVTDLGFPLITGANVLAIISVASIVGRVGMGRLADFIGNRLSYMIGYIIMVASLLWALATDELWMLYLFATTFGFSWGTLAVTRTPLLAEVFGIGSLGAILGTVEFGAQTGAIIGPFLGGWLFDLTGQYTVAFLVTAIVATAGLIMTILLRPIGSGGGK
jgi:MFS family permease